MPGKVVQTHGGCFRYSASFSLKLLACPHNMAACSKDDLASRVHRIPQSQRSEEEISEAKEY